jgi:hypothetical protein
MGWGTLIAGAMKAAQGAQGGGLITYARGGQSAQIPAARGFAELPIEQLLGVGMAAKSLDWFIVAADLKFGDTRIEPANGDLITTTDGLKFKVIQSSTTGDCFAFMDGFNASLQVHSKFVGRV